MTTITRRAAIAAPFALAAPLAAAKTLPPFTPAPDVERGEVRARFEEWRAVWAWANEPTEDEEVNRRVDILCERERALVATPAQDAGDVLLKLAMLSTCDYVLRDDGAEADALDADLLRLLGPVT